MNGFTVNPTTVQFKSAYKKLMLNNMNVLAPTSANCSPQDGTLLISDKKHLNDVTQKSHYENVQVSSQKEKKKNMNTVSCKPNFPVHEFIHRNSS